MNAIEQARKAYAPTRSPIRSDRSVEYQAFSDIVRRLTDAEALGTPGFPRLVEALHANRSLWTILAVDVASPGNKLPQDLRAQIFYLAQFTEEHTNKVLRREASAGALIEINTAVMRGLGQMGSAAPKQGKVN